MANTIKQALEMIEQLGATILADGEDYKFYPTMRPTKIEMIYIHNNTVAIQQSKNGLEWRLSSKEYCKKYYQVVGTKDDAIHIFTTLSALCGWLENEIFESMMQSVEKMKQAEAQERANQENVTVFVVRTARGLFVNTQAELYADHGNDSMIFEYTAHPEVKPEEMVTARYQLEVSDMSDDDVTKIVEKLDQLSAGVSVGAACIYAYFNDNLAAVAASVGIENTACCKTHLTEGDFNITSLANYKQQQTQDDQQAKYDYRYTGTQQQQIGGDGPIIGTTWSTAHDNPNLPGYISMGPGPYQKYHPIRPTRNLNPILTRQSLKNAFS